MLIQFDHAPLIELARAADVRIEVMPALGDFVPAGTPLVRIEGRSDRKLSSEVLRRVTVDTERSLDQDLSYGPRLLVDICGRSLTEPFDPTTAVQAIDRIHDFLRRLVQRRFPTGEHRDEAGRVRLVTNVLTWDDYVLLSLEEICNKAGASVQVTRRLRACFEDLLACAPEERRASVERQVRLLDVVIDDASKRDADAWRQGDPQGLGASSDAAPQVRP